MVGRGASQRHRASTGGTAEALDLDAIAIEQQDTVQVAKAAGKIIVTDIGVLNFQTSLQHGLRERTARVEVYAQSAARQDFGVERLPKHHVDRAVQADVEFFSSGQMRPAVSGEIGSTSCKVEVFDQHDLVRDLEANGTDILYRLGGDLEAERLELGDRLQIAWSAQGTANVERPLEKRVSRDLSRQVNAQKRIGIQMVEGQV